MKMHVHPVLRCSGAVGHTTGTITIFVFSVLGGAHGEENGGNVGSSSALRCCGADRLGVRPFSVFLLNASETGF
jgi:hypothetical protein